MRPRTVPLALLGILLAAHPAAGMAPASAPDCEGDLPFVLDAAFSPTGRFDLAEVGRLADELFTRLYRERSPCAGIRPLQVNLAIGSEYQTLHWLRDGSVDVAIVSDLTLHLLQRDGVELLEIEPPAGLGPAILPQWRPRLVARRLAPAGVTHEEGPEEAVEGLRLLQERSWAGLADDPGALARVAREGLDRCAEPGSATRPPGPEVRLTLPSHLSSSGFLAPVADTLAWLDERSVRLPEELRPAAKSCFWHRLFRGTCFVLEGDRVRAPGEAQAPAGSEPCASRWRGEVEGEVVEVRMDGELAPEAAGEEGAAGGTGFLQATYRDHLVIRRSAAEALFGHGLFRGAEAAMPAGVAALLDRAAVRDRGPGAGVAPEAFRAFAAPEPYFGVRPFAFTAEESVRLLQEHQRLANRRGLALVLPGGGVKAAYQSRLVDSLYAEGHLRNAGVAERPGGGEGSTLNVHHVIGTSGGALLGFFVARLGPQGPWELSRVLWEKEPGVVLSAADVFGSTDLPRYLSVLIIFGLLCTVLSAFSAGASAPLAPRSRGHAAGVWRLRLALVVFSVLLLTPLLVRTVVGELHEHVPEIEGLLFLAVVVLAMFADQCVVHGADARGSHGGRVRALRPLYAALACGVLAMVVAPAATLGGRSPAWVGEPLSFGLAHLLLGALVLVAGMILPVRGPLGLRTPGGRRRTLAAAGDAALALAALPVAALWLGPTLRLIESLPAFVNGFFLILLVGAVWTVAIREQGPSIPGRWRWPLYYAALAGSTVLLLGLCRPEELVPGVGLGDALAQPSRLGAATGPFLVCLGAVVTLASGTTWVVRALPCYTLEGRKAFTASLLVAVGHVLLVYLALMALGSWWSDGPSTLELTAGFWGWLVILSLASALVLVGLGSAARGGRPLVPPLRRSLAHLADHHPDGAVLSRRFLRMLALGAFGLVWWNVVLAPAFYGNRHAEEVLELAMAQFDARYAEVHGGGDAYRLTAQFVAPANVLERDGTRYFVVVPEHQSCPSLPHHNAPGAVWYLYRSTTGLLSRDGEDPCRSLDLRTIEDRELMRHVIFASGSPFPIFPGKVTSLPAPDGGRKRLVDGGYSNDTPVEAALILGADQVLIVQSSHPLGHASSPGPVGRLLAFLGAVPGPLVADLMRLPGYLLERSQQVDRQSRRELFVVTLAPRRSERGWPPLSDFRAKTVERMRRTAKEDLEEGRRIGFVESWGPPRFQLSVTVEGSAPSARL